MRAVVALLAFAAVTFGCSDGPSEEAECIEEFEKLESAEQSATVTDDVIDNLGDYFDEELVYFTSDDRTIGGTTPAHPGGDCPVPR